MSKDEIFEKLQPVIAEQFGKKPEEITHNLSFIDDLSADSLELVDLIIALEENFKLTITDEDAEKIKTVQDAVNYIFEHQSEKES